MKKVFTLLFTFLAALCANAEELGYTFNWATSIEGTVSQSANVIGVKEASDGNYLMSIVWGGTTSAGKTISWGGKNLTDADGVEIEGADYTGTSYTPNLLFAKISPSTGEPLWKVYTNFGYFENSYCDFEPTSDGGAIVLAHARQSEGADYRLANVVGADGTVTYLQHTDADMWSYRAVLMKIDTNGKVEWTRTINALDETLEGANAAHPFYTTDIALDENENIYISGRMCTTLYFPGKNGKIVSADAFYNEGWTGDSQAEVGNAFIAEFSSDGYINDVLTFPGEGYQYTTVTRMLIDGSTMYAAGIAKKSDDGSLLQPTFTVINLEDNSQTAYKEYSVAANTGGKQNFKIFSLSLIDGSLYLTGSFVGSLTDNNVTLTATGTASTHDGYIARLDTSGNLLSGKNYGMINTGIEGVVEANDGLIALAYQMSGAGAVALAYDKALTTEVSRTTLMTSGTTLVAAAPLFDGENLVVLSRGAKAASAFYGTTEVTPALTQSYGVLFGSWKTSGSIATGISSAKADTSAAKSVYSVSGMKMAETENLAKGIYISDGRKVVVK